MSTLAAICMHMGGIAIMQPVLLMLRRLRCTVMGYMSASDVKVNQGLLHSSSVASCRETMLNRSLLMHSHKHE